MLRHEKRYAYKNKNNWKREIQIIKKEKQNMRTTRDTKYYPCSTEQETELLPRLNNFLSEKSGRELSGITYYQELSGLDYIEVVNGRRDSDKEYNVKRYFIDGIYYSNEKTFRIQCHVKNGIQWNRGFYKDSVVDLVLHTNNNVNNFFNSNNKKGETK